MTRNSAIILFAGLLAGCATPPPAASPTVVAVKKVHCEPPAGSHIVDSSNCNGSDPFVKHGVVADRSGNPLQTQGDN
jgi:hypothetical protein